MITQIGKFKILEEETKFSITYRFTFSDFLGSLWYLLTLFIGGLILYACYTKWDTNNNISFSNLIQGIIGLFVFSFGAYLLAGSLYNPRRGIFSVDKIKQEVKILDFLKTETIPINNISSVFHEMRTSNKPKMKYVMVCIRLKNGDKIDCFTVRSSIPFDIGRKVDKDLQIVSRQLGDAINKAIRK